jgi:hypothetical protein
VLRIRIADEKGKWNGYSTKKIRAVETFDETCRRQFLLERGRRCIVPMERNETTRMNGDDVGANLRILID